MTNKVRIIVNKALERLKTPKLMSRLKRSFERGAGPVYHKHLTPTTGKEDPRDTYWFADDPNFLKYAAEVGDRLSREFPAAFDAKTGFCDASGIPGDFHACRGVSQYGMDPLPMPLTDNAALVKQWDLADKLDPKDEPWLAKLVELICGHAVPAPLHIKTKGTTAIPDFETENIVKKKLGAIRILKNLKEFLGMFKAKHGVGLLEEFRVVFCHTILYRMQADSVFFKDGRWQTKDRLAPTQEEARNGLATKNTADKRVFDWRGNEVKDHFAMRMRDVFAFNGLLNYAVSAFWSCIRAVYLHRYAATFKTRGWMDKQERISQYKFIVGSDVKTMDKLIPRWFVDKFHELLKRHVEDDLVDVMAAMFKSPYLYAPNGSYEGDFDPLVGGDPLSLDFNNHPGLPSGIAQNPDMGKIWMVFNYMLATRDVGGLKSTDDIDPWLAGRNVNFGLQDMADDATFMTNFEWAAEAFKKYKSKYCVFEQEIPVIFLGDVYCQSAGRKIVLPNPVSFPVNEIVREDSVAQKEPHLTALGRAARNEIYSRHPIYRDMVAIIKEAQLKHLGQDISLLYERLSVPVSSWSEPDLIFASNPSAIYYKLDPNDVTPALLSTEMSAISPEEFWDDIRPLFKFKTSPYAQAADEGAFIKKEARYGSY